MEPVTTPRVFSNRYELTHLIARGGMAQVYRARDRLLDRPVALKVLFPELSVDRAFVERFRREAQAAANLSHPNIVPVFDWGEDGGTYFIVMEFVDGRPLSAILRASGPMPPARIADIGASVAAALAYAHRHGVVHRDVKPGNILITDDGAVKVTDFGIARAINTEESLTQTGAVMGTAAYFSPEQAEGYGVDARSDIYSLGVVLFEMLTGRTPFLGDTPVAVASKHVRDQPPLPRDINPAAPPALEAVIMKAMAKSPGDRYASAEDLRADLLRFGEGRPVEAGEPGATTVQPRVGETTQAVVPGAGRTSVVPTAGDEEPLLDPEAEERRKRTRMLVIALVVLVLILAVVGFFLMRSFGYFGGNQVAIPTVSGQTVADATASLKSADLTVSSTKTKTDAARAGTVIGTDPAEGTSVKKGSSVELIVSAGVAPAVTVSVPYVVGQQLTDAINALTAQHLNFKITNVKSNKPTGTVLNQTPPANSVVKSGTTVDLTVSGSQTAVTVPNVVGDTAAAAGSVITGANLALGTQTSACSQTITTSGLVASQTPAAQSQQPPQTPVNIVVSSGPCQVNLPNTVGMTQAQASATISGVGGLTAAFTTTTTCTVSQNGQVVTQTPAPGTQVNTPATVTMAICSATTPTSSSTTSTSSTTTTTTSSTTSSSTTSSTT